MSAQTSWSNIFNLFMSLWVYNQQLLNENKCGYTSFVFQHRCPLSLNVVSIVSLCQDLTAVREPSTTPEMGMDPEELQVLAVLCALHQDLRPGLLPRRGEQVRQLVPAGDIKALRWNLQLLTDSRAFYYATVKTPDISASRQRHRNVFSLYKKISSKSCWCW